MAYNQHDEEKKRNETRCLQDAIRLIQKSGENPDIFLALNGQDINRDDYESPDFMKKCVCKSGRKEIVGIEHFCATRASSHKDNSNKMIALDNTPKSKIRNISQKYDNYDSLSRLFSVTTKDILDTFIIGGFSSALTYYNSPRSTLSDHLSYCINKHCDDRHIKAYKENLEQYKRDDEVVKLYLLIEIEDSLFGLHFHNTSQNLIRSRRYISEDIVATLEKYCAELSSFDKLILCLKNVADDHANHVIVLNPHNIRDQLIRQSMIIYTYVGEDIHFDSEEHNVKLTPKYIDEMIENHKYMDALKLTAQYKPQNMYKKFLCKCVRLCDELDKCGRAYATTPMISFWRIRCQMKRMICCKKYEKDQRNLRHK